MTIERNRPESLDPSFLRGLTQSRITRRTALAGAGVLSLSAFLAACGISGQQTATHTNWVWDKAKKAGTLDFANWPLYMHVAEGTGGVESHPSLDKFTADTGIKVNYSEPIEDLAEFFAKIAPSLQQGQAIGYDIIVITNGIQMTNLQTKKWLVELDPSQLGNFYKNAAAKMQNRSFDVGNKFTIPWQSGLTGIGYNPTKTGREITSFNDLFDPAFKGKVGMFTNTQETGNFTLVGMGIDPDKSKPADWQKAADKLKQQRDSGILRKYYDQSYAKALSQGDLWLTMAWSGDIFQAKLDNPDLKFVVPNEGGLIWTDNMCIPVGAAHPVDAITYMNYVYQPEIAAMLAEYIDYITPVPGAKDVIEKDAAAATDQETKDGLLGTASSPLVFPTPDVFAKTHYYRQLDPNETTQWNTIFSSVILT